MTNIQKKDIKPLVPSTSLKDRMNLLKGSRDKALLVDISGSMSDLAYEGETRFSIMEKVLAKLPKINLFAFNSECKRVAFLSNPYGGTDLANAFYMVKSEGFKKTTLVTDGKPDSESLAFEAANGLWIDIIYIGPRPVPTFLMDLAARFGSLMDNPLVTDGSSLMLEKKIQGLLK